MDSTASAALSSRLLRDFEAGQEAQTRRAVKSEQPESGRLMGPGPFGGQEADSMTMEQDPLDPDQSSTSFAPESGFHRSRTAYSMHAQSQASASEAWNSHPSLAAQRSASMQAMPPPPQRDHRYERGQSVALGAEQPERKPLLGWYTHASEPGEQGMRQLATMQARLNERLGPEYISDRQGGGGSRMKYLEGWKAIDLANDVFGFNGWSTSIRKIETPVCREKSPGRWDIGVYVVMRVTLRDGTFHEDVGWGMMENSPSLGSGLEKAKKEAVTDALKRSLRTFGRLLGNCLYDKKWVDWVSKVKAPVEKFEMGQLHRRADLKPPPPPREEASMASTPTLNGSTPEDGDADASTASTSARPPAAAANGGLARSATAQVTNTTAGAGPNPHNHLAAAANRPRPPAAAAAPPQPNGNVNGNVGRSATAQPISAAASGSGAGSAAGFNITSDEQARLQAERRAEAMARQAKFAQRQQQQQQQRDQTPVTRSPSPTKPAQQQQQQQQQAPPAAPAAASASSSSPSAAAQVFASTPGAKWAKPGGARGPAQAQPLVKSTSSSTLGGLNEADLRAASEAMDLSQGAAPGAVAGVTSLSSAGAAGAGAKRLAAAGPRGSDGGGGGVVDRRPLGDLEVGDDGAVKRQRRA